MLQFSQVEELKGKLENSKPKEYDLEREMLGNSSARKRTGDDRHREQLRKIDKEKKEAQEVSQINCMQLNC